MLLLGRMPFDLGEVRAKLHPSLDVGVLGGTSVEDVSAAFGNHEIDAVIMGAGIDLETRLEIVRHTFEGERDHHGPHEGPGFWPQRHDDIRKCRTQRADSGLRLTAPRTAEHNSLGVFPARCR